MLVTARGVRYIRSPSPRRQPCRPSPNDAGLRSVSVNDVRPEPSKNSANPSDSPHIIHCSSRSDAPCQLRDHVMLDSLNCGQIGKKQAAIVKDLQMHPARNAIVHVDLQRVVETEKIRIHIPIHFKGEAASPGVRSRRP